MKTKFMLRLTAAAVLGAMACGCTQNTTSAAKPAAEAQAPAPKGSPWVVQGEDWPAQKAKLQAFGEQYPTSWELYEKLRADAQGGTKLTWAQMSLPAYDWSGIYSRSKLSLFFDLDHPFMGGSDTAQLTPEGQKVIDRKTEQMKKTGGEYDPISDCRPPGTPRWFSEPFLKEYIVTPQQTWLINEMVNDIRRVYTDGRDHTTEDDAYASWNGDTIGFWDGDMLITHTKYLNAGQYQRGIQPDYSDQVTLVERWKKVDAKTLQADVWVYDPVNLAKPWYTRQSYTALTDPDHELRIRYWDCRENSNNNITKEKDGTSQFTEFNFMTDDSKSKSKSDGASAKKAQRPPTGQ